ncbi:hypothetical protein Tco_0080472 [Tanacetum coccineum]
MLCFSASIYARDNAMDIIERFLIWTGSSEVEVASKMVEGEIDNLTMEQYLALTRGNQAPGVVKPEIGGNMNFKIKSQFMRESREDTFSKNKNDDAHEHVKRVLDIVSLFNIPRVSHDVVMLHVFPITLTGATKRDDRMIWDALDIEFPAPFIAKVRLSVARSMDKRMIQILMLQWTLWHEKIQAALFEIKEIDVLGRLAVQFCVQWNDEFEFL